MWKQWKELALKYYKKSKVLRKEALIDLEHGAYNKCISTAYFMVEAIANALFAIKKQKTIGFQGRANFIKQLVGFEEFLLFLKLHEYREKADHKEVIFSGEVARHVLKKAMELYEKIEKRFIEELRKLEG